MICRYRAGRVLASRCRRVRPRSLRWRLRSARDDRRRNGGRATVEMCLRRRLFSFAQSTRRGRDELARNRSASAGKPTANSVRRLRRVARRQLPVPLRRSYLRGLRPGSHPSSNLRLPRRTQRTDHPRSLLRDTQVLRCMRQTLTLASCAARSRRLAAPPPTSQAGVSSVCISALLPEQSVLLRREALSLSGRATEVADRQPTPPENPRRSYTGL